MQCSVIVLSLLRLCRLGEDPGAGGGSEGGGVGSDYLASDHLGEAEGGGVQV